MYQYTQYIYIYFLWLGVYFFFKDYGTLFIVCSSFALFDAIFSTTNRQIVLMKK